LWKRHRQQIERLCYYEYDIKDDVYLKYLDYKQCGKAKPMQNYIDHLSDTTTLIDVRDEKYSSIVLTNHTLSPLKDHKIVGLLGKQHPNSSLTKQLSRVIWKYASTATQQQIFSQSKLIVNQSMTHFTTDSCFTNVSQTYLDISWWNVKLCGKNWGPDVFQVLEYSRQTSTRSSMNVQASSSHWPMQAEWLTRVYHQSLQQKNHPSTEQYTGWATKNVALYFSQLSTDFQNSFTGTLCRQFAIMRLLYISPHRKYVSKLPCEI